MALPNKEQEAFAIARIMTRHHVDASKAREIYGIETGQLESDVVGKPAPDDADDVEKSLADTVDDIFYPPQDLDAFAKSLGFDAFPPVEDDEPSSD